MIKDLIKDFVPPILLKVRRLIIRKKGASRYGASDNDYNAQKYWDERHEKYGFDTLKGVGHAGLTEADNYAWYEAAKYIFLGILEELEISKEKGKILELGYGTGFYANILENVGYKNYQGVDISDIHIKNLEKSNPTYVGRFFKMDVGMEYFECENCDLIFMIDVSQHIVNDQKMIFCLQQNVKQNLKDKGVFLVTDELSNKKFSFYEVSRTIDFFQNALGLQLFHKPIQFRDKYIFSFVKNVEKA